VKVRAKFLVNDTRVFLEKKAGVAEADTYINANYVHSPMGLDRKFIAA
jgi:protein tyrosine phosphatase